MILVVLSALSLMLTFAAFSYALFWYEAASSSYREHIEKISRGKVFLLLLRGTLWSVYSQLLVGLFYPLHLWKTLWKPPVSQADSNIPVIIFVHGLYHNMSAWIFFRWWLKRAGLVDIRAWDCLLWKYSFEELMDRLTLWMDGIHNDFPDRPLILVGHSLGGLLLRTYAQRQSASRNVAGVITLGAPHQGTKTGVFGLSKVCREITYRSPLIVKIEQEASKFDIPQVALFSPIDNVVLPAEALKVPHGGWIHREINPISHIAMLYHKPTARIVVEFVQKNCMPHGVGFSDPASSSPPQQGYDKQD